MARRRAAPSIPTAEPVTWRDGVHITGTPVWCDARRARDVCFVSSAERVARAGHGQLIGTLATLAQVGALGAGALAVPYRRPFTLGTVRLELVPSGHAIGAAALWLDVGGERVLYASAMCPSGAGLAEPLELRGCDTLVVAAPYGDARRFPKRAAARDAVIAWAREVGAAGDVPVALVTSPSKGLDVADALARAGFVVGAHVAIHQAAARLAAAAVAVPMMKRGHRGATAMVWLARPHARVAIPRAKIALVSGRATDDDALASTGAQVGFAWSNMTDRAELLALIAASGARRIYLTGHAAEAIAAEVGPHARALGPPRQMALFPTAAP